MGLLVPEKGVEVHTIDCETLAGHEEDDMDRWLDLAWTAEAEDNAVSIARIEAVLHNGQGVLAEIAKTVSENRGNIASVKTRRRSTDFFDMEFDVEVFDARHLANILAALRMCPSVVSAKRKRAEHEEINE